MARPSADAAAIAAATMAASLCEGLVGITINDDPERRQAAYLSAYRDFLDKIAGIEPMPEPKFGAD